MTTDEEIEVLATKVNELCGICVELQKAMSKTRHFISLLESHDVIGTLSLHKFQIDGEEHQVMLLARRVRELEKNQ